MFHHTFRKRTSYNSRENMEMDFGVFESHFGQIWEQVRSDQNNITPKIHQNPLVGHFHLGWYFRG
jgi:hypothetical protein